MFKFLRKNIFLSVLIVLLVCAPLMVACGSKSLKPVDQSSITYDGDIIEWSPVQNATKYALRINGTSYTSYSSVYSFPCDTYDFDTIEVSIKAQNEGNESEEVVKTFHKLATITEPSITFDEFGNMSWNAIQGAAGYIVEVNNKQNTVKASEFNKFDIGVENTIRIKAIGADNTYFAAWSPAIKKTYLPAPTDVNYDGQFLTWRGTQSASGYTVYINGGIYSTSTSTNMLYDSGRNNFTVEVRADGNGQSVFTSKNSDIKEFKFLGQVTNIRVEEGVLVWDKVDGAVAYDVQVSNSGTKRVQTNKFDIVAGSTQNIKIKPLAEEGSVFFSDWSDEQSFFVLLAPDLQWDNSTTPDGEDMSNLYWNPVNGTVSGYNVRVKTPSGQVNDFPVTNTDTAFRYAYLETGEYTITVQTLASVGTGFSSSAYSKSMTVIRLAPPNQASSNFITSNPEDIAEGFTVYYSAVSGASGYQLYKDFEKTGQIGSGTSMRVTQIINQNTSEMQTIQYQIQAVGSAPRTMSDGTKVVTLSSLSANSLTFDITVLPTPSNVEIEGKRVTWDEISKAAGYVVNIGNSMTALNAYFDLSAITNAGAHNLKVCAKGDGAALLPSNYTPVIKLMKLASPSNIRVQTDVDEGKLVWDQVNNARSYQIYFNGSDTPIEDDKVDNINQYIRTNTVTVVMEAVADYWDPDHTEYFISSNLSLAQRFTKLAIVQFPRPAFNNGELVWNPPSNITSANITYKVYDERGYAYDGQINGVRMNISNLQGGNFYTFYVKAIGDGREFINSDMSDPVTVFKLETPEVTRSENAYQWYGVASAGTYVVRVDGNLVATIQHDGVNKLYEYVPAFDQIKTYQVTVTAVGDGGYETIDSNSRLVMQEVKQLTTPAIKASYDMPSFDVNGNIVIEVTTPSQYASGYKYMVGGLVVKDKTSDLTYKYNVRNKGSFVVSVVALGGTFDSAGNYYIDSNVAGGNDNYKITLLSVPNQDSITISRDGRITWTAVSDAGGYDLVIKYNDGTTNSVHVTGANYTDKNFDNIASIDIRATGNGVTTVTSEYVTYYRR